jgi:TolB-like protein/tetratricopeptide (TPR) repeat protein
VQFGAFELDAREGRLLKHGIAVPLRDQPLQVMIALVERAGGLVTREELRQRLWSDREFGDFEAGLNTAMSRLRQVLNDSVASPRFIETLPKRGYRFIAPILKQVSVAVMPFANHSSEPSHDYFSDALTEELIGALSRITGLRVAGLNVVSRFKDRTQNMQQAGRELHVQAILAGSVDRAADRIRIHVHLIEVEGGLELWSERFDAEWKDVFTIQGTICEHVANALEVRLAKNSVESRPVNPEAYTAYLKGHYLTKRHTPAKAARALEYYEEAIRIDPGYALPYHGASLIYILNAVVGTAPPRQSLADAERFLARGLALDADSAMVQNTLAMLRMFEWRWDEAENAYRRAIALEPANPHPHMMYALQCSFQGRHTKALREARKALELDPVDPMMNFRLVQCLYYARCYEDAAESSRTAIELSPDFPYTYGYFAWALVGLSMFEEAWTIACKARSLGDGQPQVEGNFGSVAALTGHGAEAREVVEALEGRRASGYAAATPIARIHLGMGDTEACLDWLETAFEDGDPYLASALVYPGYDRLRSEPRFKRLLRRVGFTNYKQLRSAPGLGDCA